MSGLLCLEAGKRLTSQEALNNGWVVKAAEASALHISTLLPAEEEVVLVEAAAAAEEEHGDVDRLMAKAVIQRLVE